MLSPKSTQNIVVLLTHLFYSDYFQGAITKTHSATIMYLEIGESFIVI